VTAYGLTVIDAVAFRIVFVTVPLVAAYIALPSNVQVSMYVPGSVWGAGRRRRPLRSSGTRPGPTVNTSDTAYM
jgi:hypothetical protein